MLCLDPLPKLCGLKGFFLRKWHCSHKYLHLLKYLKPICSMLVLISFLTLPTPVFSLALQKYMLLLDYSFLSVPSTQSNIILGKGGGGMFDKDFDMKDHIPSVNLHTTISGTCINLNHFYCLQPLKLRFITSRLDHQIPPTPII